MKRMMMSVLGGAMFVGLSAVGGERPYETGADKGAEKPGEAGLVQLVICLDTSGSMEQLIESAKQKLWAIVNDLALAEPTPRLEVALLTFGNDGHNPENGWVAVDTPFTEDLDMVSEGLFGLTTNGGTEYVGRVLNAASKLAWHPSEGTLKLAVVAGNESADQDAEMPFRDVCRTLIANGIMVNSIYCGPVGDELAPAWKEVATLTDGKFASIDKDHGTIVIATPFDDQLTALSTSINTTYLPYGEQGEWGSSNQARQDDNAAGLNQAAAAQRCVTKGSQLYSCGNWDLVDACKGADFKLEDVKVEDLPEAMQAMTPEERKTHIAAMGQQRDGIRAEIAEVTKKREVFVRDEMKRQALDDTKSFDNAIRQAVREQARSKGFAFKDASAKDE